MERVLKAVPVDLRVKMEALVHDLSLALEESSNSTNVKRRWGLRRRARSTGNIPSLNANKHSEDSSSSICDIRIPKTSVTKYQSDSDDTDRRESFARFWNLNTISNVESDSVNEYFVPRINTKRKRKFKRMAVDSNNPSTSQAITQKKRLFRNNCENRYSTIWCGKRKRSCRERSIDCEMRSPKPTRNSKSKSHRGKMRSENAMDCSRISSSSISSSDSEAGIRANEEDHEGDDEQSDWIGESSWWDDESTTEEKVMSSDPALQTLINYRQRVLNGREIRAGRRHVDNKPGYSIITSANEKVSRFLQDPSQSELKLHAMRQPEREKLRRLANLYSLSLKGDLSCPILYKTRHTTQAICVDQVSFNRFSDYKRLRKTPPQSPNPEVIVANPEVPVFSGNFAVPVVNHSQNSSEPMSFEWGAHNMEAEVGSTPKFNTHFGQSKSS
ncbi:G patch domain-containing protein 2-like isoform X2 [Diachasma alloeum]|uniref:G patch domain-containing protein 2-like isoform X2 n=1 Tax=Diachasma alloeum TaxID=454923 RepID=UPI0007382D40|nr:G patch domain-containing protein 2-like isoform X2 [Diachasma alloeum]